MDLGESSLTNNEVDKLAQDEFWLQKIKSNLGKNRELSEKMVSILDSFDRLLLDLDGTVMRLCQKTGSLQEKQLNVSALMQEVDRALCFYNAGIEIDAELKVLSPAENLSKYLKLMKKLKESISFFSSDPTLEVKRERMQSTFDFGCIALEQEFKTMLRQSRASLSASDFLSAMDDGYEINRNTDLFNVLIGGNEQAMKQLCSWLISESSSKHYVDIYADVASSSAVRILTGIAGSNLTNVKEDSALRSKEIEERFIDTAFKLSKEEKAACISAAMTKSFSFLIDNCGDFINKARRYIERGDLASVFCLLPLLKYINSKRDVLTSFLKNTSTPLQNSFQNVMTSIHSEGTCALEKFVDHVKSDSEKFVPPDCTVHQLTSNALMYLQQLVHQTDALGALLGSEGDEPPKEAVPKYFARVLSALGLNLRNKAELYVNPALKAMFMLNNLTHILKVITKNGVLHIVSEQNRNVEQYYNDQLDQFKTQYLQSWLNLQALLSNFLRRTEVTISHSGQRLREKDREHIKSIFSDFNRHVDAIAKEHCDLVVPDANLASQLRAECKQNVLPLYTELYEKYSKLNFTKNFEKYVKLTPQNVEQLIESLFSVTLPIQ
ncbi:Exo70 exocyst complex subunit family protein [Trichuris trichiura]|uniref:Exocyst complex component 7 n=1 Tax=Trichuris trichiura TaxID=36087 RepID=A0A077Z1X8_TRITR|nr:Exo70 exocyst complex subunit family protein [Trichuris trichiura]